jgi:hypothetical protein
MSKMSDKDKAIFDQGERLLMYACFFAGGFVFALYALAYSGVQCS